ncbi:unnamed protein product [Victoria cruziana]
MSSEFTFKCFTPQHAGFPVGLGCQSRNEEVKRYPSKKNLRTIIGGTSQILDVPWIVPWRRKPHDILSLLMLG